MNPLRTTARLLAVATAALLAACGGGDGAADAGSATPTPARTGDYATKTNYQPQQALAEYEPPPSGFAPVYTELVARHGTRGLSSMKYDDAVLNLWARARADGALTPLGEKLGPDVEKIMKANFLLGYGVPGIGNAGYGNLTQVGMAEHQQLAARLAQRLPSLFGAAAANGPQRQIEVLHSGQDRAVDSSQFFAVSLARNAPAVAASITAPGVNRYQLYFHKLSAATDPVGNTPGASAEVLQASLDYQAFAAAKDASGFGAEAAAKIAAARTTPDIKAHARAVLERLFTSGFIDKIEAGTYRFANDSTRRYTSGDGRFTNQLTGDGKTRIQSAVDAAALIYELYVIAPGMRQEAGVDFAPYMPLEHAHAFAYLQDIDDFYSKGPSATEYGGVTYRMAGGLLRDFFDEVDRINQGQRGRAARLRFTHAEVMVPFATALGLPGATTPVPRAQTYAYATNPWRGEAISPMATNVQWDVVQDGRGTVLVKMLFNEKEADFRPACDSARYTTGSHYYAFNRLKGCFGF